ncbi:MAG TPA: hypothetical protein VIJ28_05125 [Chloroflexota bacterium]
MERSRSWITMVPRVAAILVLVGTMVHSSPSQAAGRPAPSRPASRGPAVTQLYLTTDQAFLAFEPRHAVAPPMVNHFPPAVEYLAAYFSFAGAKAGKTTYHVDFLTGGKTVRRGASHRLTTATGSYLLDLPGLSLRRPGKYLAEVYLGARRAATTVFWLIRTPRAHVAYLITGAAFARFHPAKPTRPARTGKLLAGMKQLGMYVEYTGAIRGDTISMAVYDHYGRLSASSGTHALPRRPNGADAVLLRPASGSFPAGIYRADLYLDDVLVVSVPWRAR